MLKKKRTGAAWIKEVAKEQEATALKRLYEIRWRELYNEIPRETASIL